MELPTLCFPAEVKRRSMSLLSSAATGRWQWRRMKPRDKKLILNMFYCVSCQWNASFPADKMPCRTLLPPTGQPPARVVGAQLHPQLHPVQLWFFLGRLMWWRRLTEVESEHRNGGRKWLWTWRACCQMACWSEVRAARVTSWGVTLILRRWTDDGT